MRNKLCHLMVIFVMFIRYKLLHYREIPPIYWMTLVLLLLVVEAGFYRDVVERLPVNPAIGFDSRLGQTEIF